MQQPIGSSAPESLDEAIRLGLWEVSRQEAQFGIRLTRDLEAEILGLVLESFLTERLGGEVTARLTDPDRR